ncbi:uncharacterized protein LOC143541889 [Bidens hawaiensis]|uniref:uncharacterized protein LOC143541889 n=1 Tax=Bidens hawaiensis TaxID=980011 RepID=UPI004049C8BA
MIEDDPFNLDPFILGSDVYVVKTRGEDPVATSNSFQALIVEEDNELQDMEVNRVDKSEEVLSANVPKEVDATKVIGVKLGVQLEGFEALLENSIQGAGLQAAIQESLLTADSRFDFDILWGAGDYGVDSVCASGRSGGLINMWNVRKFIKVGSVEDRNFLITRGTLVEDGSVLNLVNVYAPQKANEKKALWERLIGIIQGERGCGCVLEYIMQGNKFTFSSGTGNECKLSKIDHVLVCQEFFNRWSGACLRALPRLERDGCEQVVIGALQGSYGNGPADVMLHRKLGAVRSGLREWWKKVSNKEGEHLELIKKDIQDLERLMETRDLEEEEVWVWEEGKKEMENMLILKNRDLQQKSRVKWASLGDENSGSFHRCIKGRRAANAIPGLVVDGSWISKPPLVKREVLRFFRNNFKEYCFHRPVFCCDYLKQVSEGGIGELTKPFSKEEVKAAAFDCGAEKAPGRTALTLGLLCTSGRIWRKIL